MLVYKILRATEWVVFDRKGVFAGSAADLRDGFIHLSTADQVIATQAKYFAADTGLVFVALDTDAIGAAVRWEAARGGALFPHLFRPMTRDDIVEIAASPPLAPEG